MAILAYITERCRSEAAEHALVEDLTKLQTRLEKTQNLSQFDRFPVPFMVKKKFGGQQARLIAQQRNLGDHAVVIFLAVMIKGSHDYPAFVKNTKLKIPQFEGAFSDAEIECFVAERTRTTPPPEKPRPSDAEAALIYGGFGRSAELGPVDLVYETGTWVKRVSEDSIAKRLALFREPCFNALAREPGLHFEENSAGGAGVWAWRAAQELVLITPSTPDTRSRDQAYAESFVEDLQARLQQGQNDSILKLSQRAYPDLILCDDDLWIDLEKAPEANLALSPEESRVLESARGAQARFPLFINGRAGSGKSTILQYLMADMLLHYAAQADPGVMAPPIYLTASEELLRAARRLIERLLRSGGEYFAQPAARAYLQRSSDWIDRAFKVFDRHLRNLLPASDEGRFNPAACVDYRRFSGMWNQRFGKERKAVREYGPDISWHVIRTYIKGNDADSYMEPDDYAGIPENQITVTKEAFKHVYNTVWSWYQEEIQHGGLWDDQDLARFILNEKLVQPIYPAVFCDEAQDFTRLELEILLRLNLFSDRSIPPRDATRVPFVFAGDQFQTLNPTGFRWDAIKGTFVEKFVFALDPAGRSGNLAPNFQELQFNYRSTSPIVKFANHVQLMRAALFGLSDVKPQRPWALESGAFPVVWFDRNDQSLWNQLRNNSSFVVIVPCREGEEAEYVRQDPTLSAHIQFESEVPTNVLSAVRAKGQEYKAVIVYGFGEAAPASIEQALRSDPGELGADPDRSLPVQYFLNRLYVAVSRAKRRLVIVDSKEGMKKLWNCEHDEAIEARMLERMPPAVRSEWKDNIAAMVIGTAANLGEESGDPKENAQAFEAEGRARGDAFLLWQAMQAYRSAGDAVKTRECRARALEAEGKLYEAGEAFWHAGLSADAVRCLWRAGRGGWTRLSDLWFESVAIRPEIECRWAKLIQGGPDLNEAGRVLEAFAGELDKKPAFQAQCAAEVIWGDAIAAVLDPLFESAHAGNARPSDWRDIILSLDRIQKHLVEVPALTCARVYYRAERYKEAIQLWDRTSALRSDEYDRAKALVGPYPDNITSMTKAKMYGEIVEAYRRAPDLVLTPAQAKEVANALIEEDEADDALEFAWRAGISDPAFRLAERWSHGGSDAKLKRALLAGVALLVKERKWEQVEKVLDSSANIANALDQGRALRAAMVQNALALRAFLIRALARTGNVEQAPKSVSRQIQSSLNSYLRVKDGDWMDKLSVQEAGAALERGGRFTDAVAFYEALQKAARQEDDRLFAQARWVVCKRRQADYEREQNATGKVQLIEREIANSIHDWQFDAKMVLPEFPELPPLEMPPLTAAARAGAGHRLADESRQTKVVAAPAPQPRVDALHLVCGDFNLDFSRVQGRCNLTHNPSMETAFIKTTDRRCGGEKEFLETSGVWRCQEWGITVQFPDAVSGTLTIQFERVGAAIQLAVGN